MSAKFEAKVTHHFAADPERVFDALTDPGTVPLWLRVWLEKSGTGGELLRCEIDPREGGSFFYSDRRGEEETRSWGTFSTLHRPTRIVHSWITEESEEEDPSIVTIIIEPAPDHDGSTVTLYHEMDAQWEAHRESAERAWMAMLASVDEVIAA